MVEYPVVNVLLLPMSQWVDSVGIPSLTAVMELSIHNGRFLTFCSKDDHNIWDFL